MVLNKMWNKNKTPFKYHEIYRKLKKIGARVP